MNVFKTLLRWVNPYSVCEFYSIDFRTHKESEGVYCMCAIFSNLSNLSFLMLTGINQLVVRNGWRPSHNLWEHDLTNAKRPLTQSVGYSPHLLMLYIGYEFIAPLSPWVLSPPFLCYIDCGISNCAIITFPMEKGFLLYLHLHYNYEVFSFSVFSFI